MSTQTPNPNCAQIPDGPLSPIPYHVVCDNLPTVVRLEFSPTLSGSAVLMMIKSLLVTAGNVPVVSSGVSSCTDNLGQPWQVAASGATTADTTITTTSARLSATDQKPKKQHVRRATQVLSPQAGTATLEGISSITCQLDFPDFADPEATTSEGKFSVLAMQLYEVAGAAPGSTLYASACSAAPPRNAVTILADYTYGQDYVPNPILGNYGVVGANNSALLTESLVPSGTFSLPLYFTSSYATVGDSGSGSSLEFAGGQACYTAVVPLNVPMTDSGTNLGDCSEGPCENVGGHPINLTNGNVFLKQRDYALPGLGGGIALERTWNSLWPLSPHANTATARMFGDSWTSNFEERLVFVDGNTID